MIDLKITINLKEKTLSFNKNKINLESTLKDTEVFNEENGNKCLDLIYENNKDIYPEACRLIKFMKENKLGKQLYIRPYEHKNDAVQIKGDYKLNIIRSYETPIEILDLP